MGSYISIGFIMDNDAWMENKCIRLLSQNSNDIIKMVLKSPNSKQYDQWSYSDVNIFNLKKAIEQCSLFEMAQIQLDYRVEQHIITGILISVRKRGDICGLLIELPECNFDLINGIDDLEYNIVAYMKQQLRNGDFLYAFCDNEVDVSGHYIFDCENTEEYSILVYQLEDGRTIVKFAPWKVDGLTSRRE